MCKERSLWDNTIEKHLELPDWYLLCLRRITADFSVAYISSVLKNKINQPYAKKLGGLLGSSNRKGNKIICDLRKVTKSAQSLKESFAPAYLGRRNKLGAYLYLIYDCNTYHA